MQEEQPNFKVTDRRLFNADGSPRDLPPEEKQETPVAAAPEAPLEEQTQAQPEEEIPVEAAPEPQAAEEEFTEEDLADARDPASFVSFLMLLAQNAASALGMHTHQFVSEGKLVEALRNSGVEV